MTILKGKHLYTLIKSCTDARLAKNRSEGIMFACNTVKTILLLVSATCFIQSDFCYDIACSRPTIN